MTTNQNSDTDSTLPVRRGRVDSVDLFEVKEHELEILENGGSDSIFLNFAIFLISTAFSAILSLCTSTFIKPLYETLFLIIAVVGIIGGGFLLILWLKQRKSIKLVIKTIRNRIFCEPPRSNSPTQVSITQTDIEISTAPK